MFLQDYFCLSIYEIVLLLRWNREATYGLSDYLSKIVIMSVWSSGSTGEVLRQQLSTEQLLRGNQTMGARSD